MMRLRNLIRIIAIKLRCILLTKFYKMNISKSARISFGAKLDKTNGGGYTLIIRHI